MPSLSGYRVLDLTEGAAAIGPMILADLGADVVKVEPPGGSSSRSIPPVDATDGHSLQFSLYNRNKRGITLDLSTLTGRDTLLALVANADFLFENAPPGEMSARGLSFQALRAANPRIIHVATTPFGQDGPYANHASADLTLAAMGGHLALNGQADRAPVRISVPQAWCHAGAESAVGALVAHRRLLQTGEGQFVDVSVQACVFWTLLNAMIHAAITGKDLERAGTLLQLGTIDMRLTYPALDGEVVLMPGGATVAAICADMVREGIVPASWLEEDWKTYDFRLLRGGEALTPPPAEVESALERYTAAHTKSELFESGLPKGVTIAPVATTGDVVAFEHLHQRKYWQATTLPSGREALLPGPFVRLAGTPISYRLPAPTPGGHDAPAPEWTARPEARAEHIPGDLPFAGLKVADFSWIGVGPITAKYFADHGADVVRVETGSPIDRLRSAGPHTDGIPGVNRSQFFAGFNSSKRSINLDLKQPGAREVAQDLLAWCDVAFESFTPGTMAALGLGYETARELNPGIIMVSSCLMGQTGPAASLAGYGYHAAAISGFFEITGWPDREPGGPFNAYTDVIAPRFLAAAVMAAIEHRRRTGEGQYIEQAQMESALYFLGPELIDVQLSGAMPRRCGNESAYAAPHNVYQCEGEDQWIAIACESDAHWRALRGVLGNPGWAMDPAFDNLAGRIAARDYIDEQVAEFTYYHDRYALMALLQGAGVPAGVVQRSSDLLRDPQLAHRNFYRPMQHPEMGEVPYEGHQFQIAGSPSGPRSPAPCLGEHTFEILTETLGIDPERVASLMAAGGIA